MRAGGLLGRRSEVHRRAVPALIFFRTAGVSPAHCWERATPWRSSAVDIDAPQSGALPAKTKSMSRPEAGGPEDPTSVPSDGAVDFPDLEAATRLEGLGPG